MKGVVAAGHEAVAAAACDVLAAGGNAFDAVVAAGFAAAVAEPALTSLGGGGFLLVRTAGGEATLLDFFVDTPGLEAVAAAGEPHFVPVTVRFPSSDQDFNVGRAAVAVPGTLAGLLHAHRRFGCHPLRQVLQPAIRLAREGVRLTQQQAYFLDLLRPIMTLEESGRELMMPDGEYPQAGTLVRNQALADFLTRLPDGAAEDFYRGEIAREIARDMRAGGGLLTEADLAAYRVIERAPLALDYRDWRILTNPGPSLGGGLLALSLELLAGFEPAALGLGSPRHASLLVAVMRETERLRERGVCSAAELDAAGLAVRREAVRISSGGTTHVSVCDAAGNVASMTTSNGEGSGYVAPATGIMLNNMMGEDDLHPEGFHRDPPAQRVASMMSPCIVLEGERARLVAGSGGSKRIRTALLQVISNALDFGMEPQEAVDAPRLHWDGEAVQAEPGFAKETLDALEKRWPLNRWSVQDVYFGGVHAVCGDGRGGGDRRRGGSVRRLDA